MTDSQVLRLSRLDVRDVSDALDKLQLPGVVTGLPQRSSAPGGVSRIAGRAVTMKVGPGTPPAGPTKHLGCTAIEESGADNVIEVEQRSGVETGCLGGLLTLGAKVRGVVGVIAQGPLGDVDGGHHKRQWLPSIGLMDYFQRQIFNWRCFGHTFEPGSFGC